MSTTEALIDAAKFIGGMLLAVLVGASAGLLLVEALLRHFNI